MCLLLSQKLSYKAKTAAVVMIQHFQKFFGKYILPSSTIVSLPSSMMSKALPLIKATTLIRIKTNIFIFQSVLIAINCVGVNFNNMTNTVDDY